MLRDMLALLFFLAHPVLAYFSFVVVLVLVRVIVIVIVLAIIVRARDIRNRRPFSLQCPCGSRRSEAMLPQPKMTSRQGLSPYRGFPVESRCPEPGKFSSRAAAAPRLSTTRTITSTITSTKNEHEGKNMKPHDPKIR